MVNTVHVLCYLHTLVIGKTCDVTRNYKQVALTRERDSLPLHFTSLLLLSLAVAVAPQSHLTDTRTQHTTDC